jgi:hypothetical protein
MFDRQAEIAGHLLASEDARERATAFTETPAGVHGDEGSDQRGLEIRTRSKPHHHNPGINL